MMTILSLLRSLLVTATLSFAVPVSLIFAVHGLLALVACIPFLKTLSHALTAQVTDILAIFGNGSPLEGVIVIGLTCSLVAGLFDTYVFYQHQDSHNG
jgi:hypothetical protein